ncbi:hypothetical protein J4E83_007927 [Alternaria metachromatica]|uniref:uncharacterized protein n=1 Tax=Alternaria metachromatica TaxID=283354 RepID=UPI0020C3188D|nr:uncharacterized protein J4E83_007927 [Alternaria metachromatica]KAI4611677.1 hypothetical protein J4E83_007927 [Alternaria metachromatica]
MSTRPSFSTSRTSVSIPRKAQCEELAQRLQDAVERTTKDVAADDVQRSAFLPKPDLDQILNDRSLELLFTELVTETSSFGGGVFLQASATSTTDEEKGSDSVIDDMFINSCIGATKRKPPDESSWRALLALLLYQNNKDLLSLFVEWMVIMFDHPTAKSDNLIPSDESIPFTKATLQEYKVPNWCHRLILLDQAIFKPIMIKKLEHHDITTSERLPFMGRYHSIKSGSQGQVFKAEIAQCHWEIRENDDEENSDFIPGNPNSTKLVALKVFKDLEPMRDMPEATQDFKIELGILEELRTYKTKHKMIMLHLGSITELNETRKPIRHSIIFELASFSLGDLLKDRNHPQESVIPSRLLASLVDIIEALECLHDKLETLHLDIKPDNILIFETRSGSGDQEHYELIWKLSDFGLARKKAAKKPKAGSAQTSTATSRGSTLPATRPTGLYQAPEIQEQETSQAGRGSDVWSMGCITLTVLAFIYGGPKEVTELESCLMVRFQNLGGREPLFYIRSDSYPWRHRASHVYHYLQSRGPDVDEIPHTAGPLLAALHPSLIDWSNILVEDSYACRTEQRFVLYILNVIIGKVLLIDRSRRMGASELRDRLAYIQQEWEKYDIASDTYVYPDALAYLNLARSSSSQEDESSTDEPPQGPIVTTHHDPNQAPTGSVAPQGGLTQEQNVQMREEFCSAIELNDAPNVRLQLEQTPEILGHLCLRAGRYPIHVALLNNAYETLDVLLEKASLEITNLSCKRRTALDLALDSGKAAALDCIRTHRNKFDFPPELYKRRKDGLGSEAREIADDLFGTKKAATPKGRKPIFRIPRGRTFNSST